MQRLRLKAPVRMDVNPSTNNEQLYRVVNTMATNQAMTLLTSQSYYNDKGDPSRRVVLPSSPSALSKVSCRGHIVD